jgi:hypothetical protein
VFSLEVIACRRGASEQEVATSPGFYLKSSSFRVCTIRFPVTAMTKRYDHASEERYRGVIEALDTARWKQS